MDKKRKNKSQKKSDPIEDILEDLPLFKYLSEQKLKEKIVIPENNIENVDAKFYENQEENYFQETKKEKIKVNKKENLDDKHQSHSNQLFIPLTYEEAVQEVGNDIAKMSDFIVPVTDFEKQIIQVVNDIQYSGYILFLYGVSGIGKSTFISSLEWRKHIPIKQIKSINAGKLGSDQSNTKLKKLLQCITESARLFFEKSSKQDDKLCIIIDYLENLEDEDEKQVKGFFRDLNGLLRQYPILIVWPVTDRDDLENMNNLAKTFSSTMFHRRLPTLEFSGPPIEVYPEIAKKTIMFFNKGKNPSDFQLHNPDFNKLRKNYKAKNPEQQIIREYLKEVIGIWEQRTKRIEKMMENMPKPTEVWFIVCYPEAENVVAQFAKQSSDIVTEMWNADHQRLMAYTRDNQMGANWGSERLALAISGVLTTKIMYLPTNTLVSCIVSYAKDAGVPITEQSFQETGIPNSWFKKSSALDTLKRSPLYLQLSGKASKTGKRRSGTVEKSLERAKEPFEKINRTIVDESDKPFNNALCVALIDACDDLKDLSFACEKNHPIIQTIRPDILVEVKESKVQVKESKYICIEMYYTTKPAPNILAKYVLNKLNTYMNQLGIGRDKIFE